MLHDSVDQKDGGWCVATRFFCRKEGMAVLGGVPRSGACRVTECHNYYASRFARRQAGGKPSNGRLRRLWQDGGLAAGAYHKSVVDQDVRSVQPLGKLFRACLVHQRHERQTLSAGQSATGPVREAELARGCEVQE